MWKLLKPPRLYVLSLLSAIALAACYVVLNLHGIVGPLSATTGVVLLLTLFALVVGHVGHSASRAIARRRAARHACAQRPPLTDEEFLATLKIDASSPTARIALTVRDAFAQASRLNAAQIRHDDKLQSGLFDSLDYLDIIFQIEKRLNAKVPTTKFFQTLEDMGPHDFEVGHIIAATIRVNKVGEPHHRSA